MDVPENGSNDVFSRLVTLVSSGDIMGTSENTGTINYISMNEDSKILKLGKPIK